MKSCCVGVVIFVACFCHGVFSSPLITTVRDDSRQTEVVIDDRTLTQYPSKSLPESITILTIQYSNISFVSEEHLGATPLLQELHLNNNHLDKLSAHLLRRVSDLHTLDLTGNELSSLPADVFSHAPLCNLVLKNNLIKEADADWFPDNSSLTWLDLSDNLIMKIPNALLQKFPNLENLDLSNNRLEKISSDFLNPVTKLERLNLQNNKLITLDSSLFQNTQNLTFLFLSQNELNNLPSNVFQQLSHLTNLALDDNQLNHIPTGLFDSLISLEDDGLDLSGNPLLCDGTVEYLWKWLQKNKKKAFSPDAIKCASPPPLAGRSLISLTADELNI